MDTIILPCHARPSSPRLSFSHSSTQQGGRADDEEQGQPDDHDDLLAWGSSSSSSSSSSNRITVGAYYYPWYAGDFHRGDGYVRKVLEPRPHTPTLGEYDDREATVISQHLRWSRQANIRLWVCSWWGPESREDTTTLNHILDHPEMGEDRHRHQIALFYETTGRVKESEGWDPHRVPSDIEYMCQTHFQHKNYYKIDGKPVLFVYLTRLLNSQKFDADKGGGVVLPEVIRLMRETAASICNVELYIVGDQVFGEAPAPNTKYVPFEHLDAVTNYDLYGNIDKTPCAGAEAVLEYYEQQDDWKIAANASGVSYVPAVSPGYNDRAVRLKAAHKALSRRLSPDEAEGSLLAFQLLQARELVDEGADHLLMVNSFNEWHEDTQIEPCVGPTTTQPEIYTNGLVYEGYGELYLDILRMATTATDSDDTFMDTPTTCTGNCSDTEDEEEEEEHEDEEDEWTITPGGAFNGSDDTNATDADSYPIFTNSPSNDMTTETTSVVHQEEPPLSSDACRPSGLLIPTKETIFDDSTNTTDSEPHENSPSSSILMLSGTLGSTIQILENATIIRVVDRQSVYHGVQLDLSSQVESIQVGAPFSISFQVRVIRPGLEDVLMDCAGVGQNCLQAFTDFLPRSGTNGGIQTIPKYEAPPHRPVRYGEWMRIDETFVFTPEELDPTNAFLSFRIGGGEIGADLEIRQFSFHRAEPQQDVLVL